MSLFRGIPSCHIELLILIWFFITEVVKGQNPVEISSLNEFSEKASSGDMLLLENNAENREFYQKYNYPVLVMNEEWVIVKK